MSLAVGSPDLAAEQGDLVTQGEDLGVSRS
jgi:hypothetical protein